MSKIAVRGVIVGSEYDDYWHKDWIANGVITPLSVFVHQLAEAKTNEELVVEINSQGGSVIAGNQMINAVLGWKVKTGQRVSVEVGALAASMAAAMLTAIADDAKAHENSIIMFHGAQTYEEGGEQAMRDTAELLAKLNATIKGRLITSYGLDPELVASWFAEGRAGWLSAQDALKYGLVDAVINERAADVAMENIENIGIKELKMAAVKQLRSEARQYQEKGQEDGSEDENNAGENSEGGNNADGNDGSDSSGDEAESGATHGTGDEQTGNADGGEEQSAEETEGSDGVGAGDSAKLLEMADKVNNLIKAKNDAEANARKLQGERDSLQAELEKQARAHETELTDVQCNLEKVEAKLEKLLSGAMQFSSGPMGWEDALAQCDGNYAQAAKAFPELRNEYNKKKKAERDAR